MWHTYPGIVTLAAFILLSGPMAAAAASPRSQVSLPVEIAGDAGASQSVTFSLAPGLRQQVRSLWMQIHGMAYAGMVSVRINQTEWRQLSNETVTVAEPGSSYGGIGGGFSTLKVTLHLPEGAVVDNSNTIQFRFNFTDGIVSGFRVLAFNFLTADGLKILPPDAFIEEDPNAWAPPFRDPENISAGRNLWRTAQLTASALSAAHIHAHCSDCHAQEGRDLNYFNFSNLSIVARSRFHGLSEAQGRQIASYIRSLPGPNPGRPWNPPYQPGHRQGPGIDHEPVSNWPAGAGLASVLDDDIDTLPFLTSVDAFRPDSNLNPREIPIAFQLPDWNHWLPRVHPLDFREAAFRRSAFSQLASDYRRLIAIGGIPAFFDRWSKSRNTFLTPHLTAASNRWTPRLAEEVYSAQLWQLVKTWEITQTLGLEDGGPELRFWGNTIPAETAPAEAGIPNGPSGMGRSALTNEYFNNAWYELQVLVNSGNHRHHGRLPVDWIYVAGHFLDLQRLSGRPEPGRLLVMVAKAMQSTDQAIGPGNYAEGWRPDRGIDPRILVSTSWEATFRTVPIDSKQAIAESLLSAWLDKTMQYPLPSYFVRGAQPDAYKLPSSRLDISGGRVWEASSRFLAAGVSPALIERLNEWGKAYVAMADRFHY